jgi:rod shape-determining protein MreB and related proteins
MRIPRRCQVAIDLGTAFIRVVTEKGTFTIPTALAPESLLCNGVVTNPQAVANILRPFLGQSKRLGFLKPRVVVGAPTDATIKERESLTTALRTAGSASIEIVPEPLAAAIGAGVDILSSYAQMIVDVGDGVTDCAIVLAGEVLESKASRVGCSSMRESVQASFCNCWGISLTAAEADHIIAKAGVGISQSTDTQIPFRSLNCDTDPSALPTVSVEELQAMIEPSVLKIIGTVTGLLRKVSPALGCEIIESGIVLTGGGALLPGLKERLLEATSIRVTTPAKPLDAVAKGLSGMLVHAENTC